MDKHEYDAVRLNCDLWHAVRALDFEIHNLPADARSSMLNMQVALREIAWSHMQSLRMEWNAKHKEKNDGNA